MMRHTRVAPSALLLVLSVAVVSGSPSGLNNIPTADVVSRDVLVLQQWTAFGEDRGPAYQLGAKYGAGPGLEVGADGTVAPSPSGPLTFQAKYQFPTTSERTRLAVGVANLSTDTDRAGHAMPYAVVTQQMDGFRLHLGYSLQGGDATSSRGFFVGADAPVTNSLTLRSDWVEAHSPGDDSGVASLGFLWVLTDRWVVEGWGSFPDAAGADDSYVGKVNYVIPIPK